MPETKPLLRAPREYGGIDIRRPRWCGCSRGWSATSRQPDHHAGGEVGDGTKPAVGQHGRRVPPVGADARGLWYLSDRWAPASIVLDFGLRFQPIDLIGIPLGVLCQLVLLRFSTGRSSSGPTRSGASASSSSARDLVGLGARRRGTWLLVLIVVVGAPFVEELMYRGLLQGAFTRGFNDVLGVVIVPRGSPSSTSGPVEYPACSSSGWCSGCPRCAPGRSAWACSRTWRSTPPGSCSWSADEPAQQGDVVAAVVDDRIRDGMSTGIEGR